MYPATSPARPLVTKSATTDTRIRNMINVMISWVGATNNSFLSILYSNFSTRSLSSENRLFSFSSFEYDLISGIAERAFDKLRVRASYDSEKKADVFLIRSPNHLSEKGNEAVAELFLDAIGE